MEGLVMLKNVFIFSVALMAFFSTQLAQASMSNSIQDGDAHKLCMETATWWESYGNDIDKESWCAGIGSYAEAVCRLGGVDYKINYGDLWVKGWCADVSSLDEAYCRTDALKSFGETGQPENVKEHCLK